MPTSFRLIALFLLALCPGCLLNKEGSSGPFDGDPNAVVPAGTPPATAGQDSNAAQSPNGPQLNPAAPATSPNVVGNANAAQSPNGVPATPTASLAPAVRFVGRVPASEVLSWPGTAVEAAFTGSKGQAVFRVVGGTSYVGVSVDDGAPTRVQVQDNVPIAFGPLAQGKHKVRLTKLNEPELGVIRFSTLTTDGALNVAPAAARRIEFVGDSITLGYGVEGTRPCTNSSAMENVLKAYSGLVGATLAADISVVAWSGHGLLRNAVGVADAATVPNLFLRATATDVATAYDFPAAVAPQAVVINLGTNDFTYQSNAMPRAALDAAAFTAAYVSFAKTVRAKYPKAVLVLCTSPMLTDTYPTEEDAQWSTLQKALLATQTQLGDANVRVLSIPTMDTSGVTACDYHPSAAEQATMAALVVAELKADLGW